MQEQIIKLFLEEKSISEIADELSLEKDYVFKVCKESKVRNGCRKFSKDLIKKIIQLYEDGMTANKIGKEYAVGNHSIAKLLRDHGVTVRSKTGERKYNINENYFDSIDTPEKAYILGLLFADGHNELKKHTISMSLIESDKDLLEKIRVILNSEKPLEFIDYSNKLFNGSKCKNQYRLLLFSSHICKTLLNYGMISNKSATLYYPQINPKLNQHFIRGYFDGNGCMCFSQGKHYISTIVSTSDMCNSISQILKQEIGIHSSVLDAPNKNGITKYVSISGRLQVMKFMNYIYKDADLYLDRKHQHYIEVFGN